MRIQGCVTKHSPPADNAKIIQRNGRTDRRGQAELCAETSICYQPCRKLHGPKVQLTASVFGHRDQMKGSAFTHVQHIQSLGPGVPQYIKLRGLAPYFPLD
jgi:hypothetical protein